VADEEVVHVTELARTAHFTGGHTPGGTTWSWRSCEDGRCWDLVYADRRTPIADDGFRISANTRSPTVIVDFERGHVPGVRRGGVEAALEAADERAGAGVRGESRSPTRPEAADGRVALPGRQVFEGLDLIVHRQRTASPLDGGASGSGCDGARVRLRTTKRRGLPAQNAPLLGQPRSPMRPRCVCTKPRAYLSP
jgi:hypothetical protein